ncbi:hypothetical protein Y032_0026g1355 [Ancylostoma ceylanicum]|uniref:Uncharacterized protein n=1 Tax=Ancylostoma ceylanicum TaxID=53326 RepID=A0A016UVD9_9BILA|nr:hypothetical protein Y032_0026g1355 [Ancylostoma ceylanicum]
MIAVVFLLGVGLLHVVGAYTVDDQMPIDPVPLACTLFCIRNYKCVMVEPPDCIGCRPVPRCVQQECNTICDLPCAFLSKCVLVATDCCPKATCREMSIVISPPAQNITNESSNATTTT